MSVKSRLLAPSGSGALGMPCAARNRLPAGSWGVVAAFLIVCPVVARAGPPPQRPIIAFAGVDDPDDRYSRIAPEYEARILAALRADPEIEVYDPEYLDVQALPGRGGRHRLLTTESPQLQITAYAHALGDDVLIATILRKEDGLKVRATLYGTARGNTVVSWIGTDANDLLREIDAALGLKGPRPRPESPPAIEHLSPVVASSDVPLTLNAKVKPSEGVSVVAWSRASGTPTFKPSTFALVRDGVFSVNLPPVHAGSIEYFVSVTDEKGKILVTDGSEAQPHLVQIIAMENGDAEPPPPPSHAFAYTSFAVAGAALVVAVVFTVRTPQSALDRRTCYTVASCTAKSNALTTNQAVMWTGWGVTAVETTLGGLALHFGW